MRRPWLWSLLICTFAIYLTACGVPTQHLAQATPDKDVPSGLLSRGLTTTTSTLPVNSLTDVSICLAQRNSPLLEVTRKLPAGATINNVLRAVAQPPTQQERSEGLSTALSSAVTGTVKGGIAKVILSPDFANSSSGDQLTAVAQIVCTLTARPGIGQVQFELNGTLADVPRGDGSTTSSPVSRDDYPQLMPSGP